MSETTKKECSRCGKVKPLSDFYKSKHQKLGVESQCKECRKARSRNHYKENRKSHIERMKEYYRENRDYYIKYNKDYRSKNREYFKECRRKRYYDDLERSRRLAREYYYSNKESWRDYYRQNKDAYNARTRKRQAAKRGATPKWLTEEHHKEMEHFYAQARDCSIITGEVYHVDHIVPLQGEGICGLHVPWNLQLLPADINLSKSNAFDGGW